MRIYGRVQGVGFRWAAARKAEVLELRGYVRNCEDGCVETEVDGGAQVVETYRAWCKIGPRGAKIEKVDEEESSGAGDYVRFEIK